MEDPQDVSRLIICKDCGREVPEGNIMIHQLRACSARARRSDCTGDDQENNNNEAQPMDVDGSKTNEQADEKINRQIPTGAKSVEEHDHNNEEEEEEEEDSDFEVQIVEDDHLKSSAVSTSRLTRTRTEEDPLLATPQGGSRRRRRRLAPESETEDAAIRDVVDLVSENDDATRYQQRTGPGDHQWACPQCTLFNPKAASRCDACQFPNPERPPDPIRTDRLVGDDESSLLSPLAFVSGGALMGGLLGAAGSFIHGRDPMSAMAEGAISGVMGGALLNDVMSSSRRRRTSARAEHSVTGGTARHEDLFHELLSNRIAEFEFQQQQPLSVAQARSSASITGGYPSLEQRSDQTNLRARPRSSFRVVQEQNNDGTTTTMVMGGTSTTRIRRSQRGSPQGINDPMLSLLLHSYLEQQGRRQGMAGVADVDDMGYEELLQAFGDGTENMGANEAQIQSLPTQVVNNPEKEIPEDARQCLICLEDIVQGETRKILPCLHGFHLSCCDKWLRTNGSCPICKHRIR